MARKAAILNGMRLFSFLLILFTLWAGISFAQDKAAAGEDDVIPNLLEQLEQENARNAGNAAPLPPRLTVPGRDKKSLPYKSFEDIPEEVIAEAEAMEVFCEGNSKMATYYECECWAMRFLEQRLVRGPNVAQTEVMLDIQGQCPNTPAIAGSVYQSCIQQGDDLFPQGQDPEEYCSCVGNSYARLFERAPRRINSRYAVQLKTIATLSCTRQQPGVPVLVPPIR